MENKGRSRILAVLFVGVLMGALDIAIVGPALPAIKKSFNVDERTLAWIFTTYVLFNLVGVPMMSRLSDIFGRRALYVADVALFAVGSLIVALSPSIAVLLLGRAIQGLGSSGVFPVASAVIGDTFPPERRGRALGLIGAVFGMAFLVGPIVAGAMLAVVSWHWLFLVNLPIAAGVITVAWSTIPSTRPVLKRRFDFAGMAILGAMLAALTFGINQIDTKNFAESITASNVLPFLIAALLLVPIFIRIESRSPSPIVRLSLFRARQIAVVSALAAGAGLGEAAVVFVPALVVAIYGVTNSTASFMLVPAVLAMAIGAPGAGRMLDRIGSRWVMLVGYAFVAVGMFLVAFLGTYLAFFYVSAISVGLGLGILLGAPLRYIMLNEAPTSERASAQGILTLFTSVGQMIGGAMVGATAASLGGSVRGFASAFLVVGVTALVLTFVTLSLKSQAEERATAKRNQAAIESA
jgi:EmrB/QacA subfamily drug resistance transporter